MKQCDGGRPACAVCLKKATECSYDTDINESRSKTLKRKNEELALRIQHLELVFNYIRTGSEHEVAELVSRVRNSDDFEGIVALINQSSLLLPNHPSVVQRRDPIDYASVLAAFLHSIRSFEATEVQGLVEFMNSGASGERLRDTIDQYLQQPQAGVSAHSVALRRKEIEENVNRIFRDFCPVLKDSDSRVGHELGKTDGEHEEPDTSMDHDP